MLEPKSFMGRGVVLNVGGLKKNIMTVQMVFQKHKNILTRHTLMVVEIATIDLLSMITW
jgi:hypothetical protein